MSGQNPVTPSADGVAAAAKAAGAGGLPPVHLWNPPFCGDLDIRIARDGTWYHEGGAINRFELMRLFASILKLEDGRYYLVTPVEKVGITVDDAPFVATDFEATGSGLGQMLEFVTNVGDRAVLGAERRLRVERDAASGEPSPYVMIRSGLEALIDRKSFFRLVDLGEEHEGDFGVWSSGVFFPIVPVDEL